MPGFSIASPREIRRPKSSSSTTLGKVLIVQKNPDAARKTLEEAAQQYDLLVADYPQVPPIAEERNQLREVFV